VDVWLGLALSLVAALTVAWAYAREHDAAVTLAPVSARHPIHSVQSLLGNRSWLVGFAAECASEGVYLGALFLAPLALVQAVNASGVAFLALARCRGHPRLLSSRERLAVGLAFVGLVLLGASLVGTTPTDRPPKPILALLWLCTCLGASALLATFSKVRLTQGAALGATAGLLFAGGDTSTKLVVFGGTWVAAVVPLVVFYVLGSITLQSAFQHGDVLLAGGLANLTTNAVPIAAGVVLLDQGLPHGFAAVLQVSAFASVVGSAMLLGGRSRAPASEVEVSSDRSTKKIVRSARTTWRRP